MIKGLILSICIAIFIVSSIFTIAAFTGTLQPNLITGNVIGSDQIISYSSIGLILSFVMGLLVFLRIRR